MKPDAKPRDFRSNATGQATRMSIDESATAHLMDVLTKLYSDPELAVLREYSTNAWDSHIAAGVKRPIEVTLPTRFNPILTIRDYGEGLDAHDIEHIYSQYGTSTKRGSDDAVGMLGLGCKSGLAYTDQFVLTGYKNGTATSVMISRDADGAGTMTVVNEEPTTETGALVTIPTKPDTSLAEKAENFFHVWNEGDVLVDGEQPERINGFWIADDILLTQEVEGDFIVMGNVPYPTSELFNASRSRYDNHGYHAVCFVPIGSVNFAPSREALMDTRKTQACIETLKARIVSELDKTVVDKIENAASAKDAQEAFKHGKALGWKGKAQFQGFDVLMTLDRTPLDKNGDAVYHHIEDLVVEEAVKYSYLHVNKTSYMRATGERSPHFQLDTEPVIFKNFTGRELTQVKREKLTLWLQQQGFAQDLASKRGRRGYYSGGNLQPMVMLDKLSKIEKFWLDGRTIYDWDDVDKIVLPKTVTADGTKRLKGSYDVYANGETKRGVPANDLAGVKNLYWNRGNLWNAQSCSPVKTGALDLSDCTIVALGENRIEKFKRDFPNAMNVNDAAHKAAEGWVRTLDDEELLAHGVKNSDVAYILKNLDATAINDPQVVEMIRLNGLSTSTVGQGIQKFGQWARADTSKGEKLAEACMAKYPLVQVSHYGTTGKKVREHNNLYINAVYATEKGVN